MERGGADDGADKVVDVDAGERLTEGRTESEDDRAEEAGLEELCGAGGENVAGEEEDEEEENERARIEAETVTSRSRGDGID